MWDALEIAQARDFVAAMPDGLESSVVPGRQQLLRRPATTPGHRPGGDPPTGDLPLRRLVLRAGPDHRRPVARRARAGDPRRTVVIVAQRVSTIRDADLIVVLEDGAVVGRGTHDELLATCGTYREIVESQLTAGEVSMSASAEERRRTAQKPGTLKETERIEAGPAAPAAGRWVPAWWSRRRPAPSARRPGASSGAWRPTAPRRWPSSRSPSSASSRRRSARGCWAGRPTSSSTA